MTDRPRLDFACPHSLATIGWTEVTKRRKWCRDNCEGRYNIGSYSAYFQHDSDAALYKVRWA